MLSEVTTGDSVGFSRPIRYNNVTIKTEAYRA